jgi:hypothetical protein
LHLNADPDPQPPVTINLGVNVVKLLSFQPAFRVAQRGGRVRDDHQGDKQDLPLWQAHAGPGHQVRIESIILLALIE